MKRLRNLEERHALTLAFVRKHLPSGSTVLDLGSRNPLSELLEQHGYRVINTGYDDLDVDYPKWVDREVDAMVAFEIFEHMFAPFNILLHSKAPRLIASVPLSLWFKSAYWNDSDPWDRHYHEFEPKQFEFLLYRTGWKILDSEKWAAYNFKDFGIRQFIRYFTPRYYIVYCERTDIPRMGPVQ